MFVFYFIVSYFENEQQIIISQLSDYLNNLNTTEIENAHFVLEIPKSCNHYDALSHISFFY